VLVSPSKLCLTDLEDARTNLGDFVVGVVAAAVAMFSISGRCCCLDDKGVCREDVCLGVDIVVLVIVGVEYCLASSFSSSEEDLSLDIRRVSFGVVLVLLEVAVLLLLVL
jgi:hypothetical protein